MDHEDRTKLRRDALLLTVGLLLVFSITFAVALRWAGDNDDIVAGLGRRLAVGSAGLPICMAIFLVLEKALNRLLWQQLALVMALSALAGVVNLNAERWIIQAIHQQTLLPELPVIEPFFLIYRIWFWTFFFLSWAVMILALVYSSRVAAEQRMRSDAQALAHQAMMRSLRYQLNPHFLFNALNSTAALVSGGHAEAAEQMIGRLSAFLRAGLATDPLDSITLEAELAQQRLYLEIERVRFADRLAFRLDLPDGLRDVLVPSLILQPLVENSVKYGVAEASTLTTIHIAASEEDGRVRIEVRDDGRNHMETHAGTGVGMANVQQRLQAHFGDAASFSAGPTPPHGFASVLLFPIRRGGR